MMVEPGKYTVTETEGGIAGYTLTVAYKDGSMTPNEVDVSENQNVGYTITNTYKKDGGGHHHHDHSNPVVIPKIPPKTGDASTMMYAAMVVLAAITVVARRKK